MPRRNNFIRQCGVPALVAGMLLFAVAPAQAWSSREFCTEMDALVEAAASRFRTVRTTQATYSVDGQRRYLSLRVLPDTKICTITPDLDPTLECVYFTGILPNAERVFDSLVRQVRSCLSRGDRALARPVEERSDTTTFRTNNLTEITVDKSHIFGEEVIVRFRAADQQ